MIEGFNISCVGAGVKKSHLNYQDTVYKGHVQWSHK